MVSIARESFLGGSGEARARELVEERLGLSQSRYGGQTAKWRELNRYYLSLSPRVASRENDRPLNSKSSREPDLFVSRSFTVVEAATPPWLDTVVGNTPPVNVFSRKAGDEKRAEAVQNMIAYDWERSEVLQRSMHVAKQMFKYGTGIAKVGYKYDSYMLKRKYTRDEPDPSNPFRKDGSLRMKGVQFEQEEEVVRYDGPWLEPWNCYNFHPDPYYPRLRDMRYVCATRWTDRETLKLESENYERLTGKPLYKHLDRIPQVRQSHSEETFTREHGDDLGEAMGWSGSYLGASARNSRGRGSSGPSQDLVEIVEYWDRDDRVVYLANGETPILDGPNPFDDKEIPFVAARCHILDNQFWGYGILHPIQRSQEELNSWRNLIMRQGQLNILNIWGYDESVGISELASEMNPGDVLPIPFFANGDPGLRPLFDGKPLPAEAYRIQDMIDSDIQTTIAQPRYMDAGGGNKAGSATEAQIAASNVETRSRLMHLNGELEYTSEIARLFHSRRQQYLQDEGTSFRILGEGGVHYEQYTPEDIAGEYDFLTTGQIYGATKDVLRQQLEQAITIIKGDPAFMQMTNMYEVWREMWKMFGFTRVDRFLNKPPERTVNPAQENMILGQGEYIEVEMFDDHEAHMQAHMNAMPEMMENPQAMEQMQRHIERHQSFMKSASQQPAPQEEPGNMNGQEGNTPNFDNAVPTQGGLDASVGGAGS